MKRGLIFGSVVFLMAIALSSPIVALAKEFDNGNYRFEFPNGCKMDKEDEDNRFTTTNVKLECKGDSYLQFESGSAESNSAFYSQTDEDIADGMITTLGNSYDNINEVERGTDKYVINNKTAPYVIATYDQEFTNILGLPAESKEFVVMLIMIDIDGEKVLVQYVNDENNFDKQLPMAEKIFESVEGIGNRTAIAEQRTEEALSNLDTDTDSSDLDSTAEKAADAIDLLCVSPTPELKSACEDWKELGIK